MELSSGSGRRCCAAVGLAFFAGACAARQEGARRQLPPSTAILDVNVITMSEAENLIHQTVLISNGVIQAIGPVGAVTVPPDARRVDGAGKYLIPGLIDAFTHVDGEFTRYPILRTG